MKVLPNMCQVIWDHFCLGIIFPSVGFLHSKWWGVIIFGHIWKCVPNDLTYFCQHWTMELWMVKWGRKWHWCPWQLNLAQVIRGQCMRNFVTCSIYKSYWQKVSRGWIVGRGRMGHNLGSYQGFTQYVLSHMRPFLFGYRISLCSIFALEAVRSHEFWRYLKMCVVTFDLLAFILNNESVNGEMRS